MTFQQITSSFLRGDISQEEAENLIGRWWEEVGASPAQRDQQLQAWYDLLRSTPINKGKENMPVVDDVNNLAKFQLMIQNATTKGALSDVYRSLLAAYNRGEMSFDAFVDLSRAYENKYALPEDQWPSRQRLHELQLGPYDMGNVTGNVKLEEETDPLTAYRSQIGIGGKQFYNPAEAYQLGLFDPYKTQWDIQQRIHAPGRIYQDPTRQQGSFSEFLAARGGGLAGLIEGAQGQLRSIFGGTPKQKASFYEPDMSEPNRSLGLGYEPGKGEGAMDKGQIAELQNLLRYALRRKAGPLGAAYSAQSLPGAQRAYYEQKVAGKLDPNITSFLDWLNKNWGLEY